jgi:hypothetical protein
MTESRQNILLNRLVDGEASPAEWNEFHALAASEPALWRELAQMQREQAILTRGMEMALEAAERTELPLAQPARGTHPAAWAGWAVAAILAISWSIGLRGLVGDGRVVQSTGEQAAGLSFASPDEALNAYLDQGRRNGVVVDELPTKSLIHASPASSGEGFEVIFIRSIVEKRRVPTLVQFVPVTDEFGNQIVKARRVGAAGSM